MGYWQRSTKCCSSCFALIYSTQLNAEMLQYSVCRPWPPSWIFSTICCEKLSIFQCWLNIANRLGIIFLQIWHQGTDLPLPSWQSSYYNTLLSPTYFRREPSGQPFYFRSQKYFQPFLIYGNGLLYVFHHCELQWFWVGFGLHWWDGEYSIHHILLNAYVQVFSYAYFGNLHLQPFWILHPLEKNILSQWGTNKWLCFKTFYMQSSFPSNRMMFEYGYMRDRIWSEIRDSVVKVLLYTDSPIHENTSHILLQNGWIDKA